MEQGTKRGDYYLGLDMGTDSVGWAVTDMDYRVPKFKGNAMWGGDRQSYQLPGSVPD